MSAVIGIAMSNRSKKVLMTAEARALRALRQHSGLSMRLAGEKLGYSSSYISQIENGRENVPKGKRLSNFLKIYGVNENAFKRRVNKAATEETDEEVISSLISKLSSTETNVVRKLVEQLLGHK